MRQNGRAAVGMVIYAASRTNAAGWQYQELIRRGQFIGSVSSAFLSEAIGLEMALEFLMGFVC